MTNNSQQNVFLMSWNLSALSDNELDLFEALAQKAHASPIDATTNGKPA